MTPEHKLKMAAGRQRVAEAKRAAENQAHVSDYNAELEAGFNPPEPEPFSPPVDSEVEALRQYEEARRPKRPAAPARPPQPPDPYVEAARMADKLIQEEWAQRERMAARRRGVDPTPDAEIPVEVSERITQPDESSDGKEFVTPGYVSRWCRTTDNWGRPTSNPPRIAEMKRWGGREVKDAEGQPVTGRLGVLMEIPGKQYARRSMHYAPSGAADRDMNPHLRSAREHAEAANSQSGREIARFVGPGAVKDTSSGLWREGE